MSQRDDLCLHCLWLLKNLIGLRIVELAAFSAVKPHPTIANLILMSLRTRCLQPSGYVRPSGYLLLNLPNLQVIENKGGSSGRTRTYNPPVNSCHITLNQRYSPLP